LKLALFITAASLTPNNIMHDKINLLQKLLTRKCLKFEQCDRTEFNAGMRKYLTLRP
jgi:hypothetical protein